MTVDYERVPYAGTRYAGSTDYLVPAGIRAESAIALGEIGEGQAVEPLIEVLREKPYIVGSLISVSQQEQEKCAK